MSEGNVFGPYTSIKILPGISVVRFCYKHKIWCFLWASLALIGLLNILTWFWHQGCLWTPSDSY
jgi:hypothetical protein